MPEVILHTKTKQQLSVQISTPSQAILLIGGQGIGKAAVAQWLAAQLLGVQTEKVYEQPFIMRVTAQGKSITIDSIRQVGKFLKLKSVNQNGVKQVVVIEDASTMTTEAQNALLKNLEEPPAGTVFVLTAANEYDLLPTITSRLQIIKVLPPSKQQLADAYNGTDEEFERSYNLSSGLPGLFFALTGNKEHPLISSIETARKFLGSPSFERLSMANELSSQKQEAIALAGALKRLAAAAILNASSKNEDAKIIRWQHILEAASEAEQSLNKEANAKLALTNLALNL